MEKAPIIAKQEWLQSPIAWKRIAIGPARTNCRAADHVVVKRPPKVLCFVGEHDSCCSSRHGEREPAVPPPWPLSARQGVWPPGGEALAPQIPRTGRASGRAVCARRRAGGPGGRDRR